MGVEEVTQPSKRTEGLVTRLSERGVSSASPFSPLSCQDGLGEGSRLSCFWTTPSPQPPVSTRHLKLNPHPQPPLSYNQAGVSTGSGARLLALELSLSHPPAV